MGFMNGNVTGSKEDISKANKIGNIITSIVIAAFIVLTVLAVTHSV